jgi:peptide/nickel transport system permease protein
MNPRALLLNRLIGEHYHRSSGMHLFALAMVVVLLAAALLTPVIAPQNPADLASFNLLDSLLPPVWAEGGDPRYLLGTDDQGRDLFSTMLYGMRLSMLIGVLSVFLAMSIGVIVGLASGYAGGVVDALLMRIADVQLAFPVLLVALLIDGVVRAVSGGVYDESDAIMVLIMAIGLSFWVQYARTVRGSVIVERRKAYVEAARLMGLPAYKVLVRHILPNIAGPVFVIATINLAIAIIAEATLSFLGVGLPPTRPSLGTLVRIGNEFLFSGEWWIAIFPGLLLVAIIMSFNLLGDWLREILDPRLR